MIKKSAAFVWFVLSLLGINGLAQTPEYLMGDTTVTDCDGFLFDSGGDSGIYGNNENLTFTVNTGGVAIEVSFLNEVCIEDGFDFLNIYDGTSTAGVLLATVTGAGFIPPGVTASSGAVTFHFTSDGSAAYCGFEIFWDTIVGPPEPPVPTAIAPENCGSTTFLVEFSYPIDCEWLSADSITVIGAGELNVVSAEVNCLGQAASSALIVLDNPIDYNCDFQVFIQMGIPDVCDSVWVYTLFSQFTVDVCDVNGSVVADEAALCEGQCTEIGAFVFGCNEHTFTWNEGLPPTEGPHEVCPATTTTYTVTITETATGSAITESITIDVIQTQILINDTALCLTEPPFQIPVSGTGIWEGPGIIDAEAGIFVADSANVGVHTLYYSAGGLCTDSVAITVLPIDAGGVTAACPGSDAFQLDPEPPGGLWEGDFVTPEGLFDPAFEGSYTLTYTFGGCQDTLLVNVADISGQFSLDTLCQSNWADTIPFSPLGGLWSGPGIVDSLLGVFDPGEAPAGALTLLYAVEGCNQAFDVFIKEIFVGAAFRSSCPEQAPFIPQPNFSPPGGFWEGDGIIDNQTGLYAPGTIPNDFWTALIYYAPNGCTDTINYYNRQTVVPPDTLWWCLDDEPFLMNNQTTGRAPFGGSWSGSGVFQFDGDWFFAPSISGVGDHTVTYSANGCEDSMVMRVHPATFEIGPLGMCSDEAPFIIHPDLHLGGEWSGSGVIDAALGLFDPSISGGGQHLITWFTPAGCSAEVDVTVELFQQATILGIEDTYCFQNNDQEVLAIPPGGGLTGATSPGFFNPALAGEGTHTLNYTWEGDYCSSQTTVDVFVYPSLALVLSASDTVICQGGGSVLTGEPGGGGDVSFYNYAWSDDLFPVNEVTVAPSSSQWFTLTISDGCSDPVTDSVFIEVLPPIAVEVLLSDTLCFGAEGGFALAEVMSEGEFEVQFFGDGTPEENGILTTAGALVTLMVTDANYGCTFDSLVLVPSYSPVSALFTTNPNDECIAWGAQPIELIDFSQNGITGFWALGEGEPIAYTPGELVSTAFAQAGEYTVSLVIFNEGDCEARHDLEVCVLPPTAIFVPDVFSPNDDGLNDVLYVRGRGIIDMTFLVYDRWGEKVFESSHPEHGWDGRFRGRAMPSGAYTWLLSARLNDGSVDEQRGQVMLVR